MKLWLWLSNQQFLAIIDKNLSNFDENLSKIWILSPGVTAFQFQSRRKGRNPVKFGNTVHYSENNSNLR
jgi:hypothetical protein